MSFWTYRVMRTVDHSGRLIQPGHHIYYITEAHYEQVSGVNLPIASIGAVQIEAESIDALRDMLTQMLLTTAEPVLDADSIEEAGYYQEVPREPVQAHEEPAGAAEPGGSADPGGEPDLRCVPGERTSRSSARSDLGTVHRADHQEGE